MRALVILFFIGVSLAQIVTTNCTNPYYFQPMSTVKTAVTFSSESLVDSEIDCNGKTESKGLWLLVNNQYDYNLTVHITATEAVTFDYYKECEEACFKSDDEAYLVITSGNSILIFVTFSTPYNTIEFEPVRYGSYNKPIQAYPPFPNTISTTLPLQGGEYYSIVKLRCPIQWKIDVNISSVMKVETTITNKNLNMEKVYTTNEFQIDNEYDNVEYLLKFKSESITVIDVTFSYYQYNPTYTKDVITNYPYFRYETVPHSVQADKNDVYGFFYDVVIENEKQNVVISACESVINLDIMMLDDSVDYDKTTCENGKGCVISFNTSKPSTYRVKIGSNESRSQDFNFVLQVTKNDREGGSNMLFLWIIIAVIVIIVILICIAIAVFFMVFRKKDKDVKYSSI